MDAKNPSDVDIHVGKRMRERRKELQLSQESLAELLGITFQQIQKYERGSNRISTGRLFELAVALRTTIPYFFEGFDGASKALLRGVADADAEYAAMDAESLDLVAAFQSISDPELRKSILAMVKQQAASGGRRKRGSKD